MELTCQKASSANYIFISFCAATFAINSSGMFVSFEFNFIKKSQKKILSYSKSISPVSIHFFKNNKISRVSLLKLRIELDRITYLATKSDGICLFTVNSVAEKKTIKKC